MAIEGCVALLSLASVYWLLKGQLQLRSSLFLEKKVSAKLRDEASHWQKHAKRFLEGLSASIDYQLEKWGLTKSEKEVAFLLIKGLSLKEIADIRSTAEKTTRAQAASIYAKSGLSGRSQLAAFFLEDLLSPQDL